MPSRRPFCLLVDPIEEMAAILAALNLIVIFMQMFPFLSSKQCLEWSVEFYTLKKAYS